jgi:hypothetical protein
MKRFDSHQFDENTFVVIDNIEQREICVCTNYDDWEDAKVRADNIVMLLNEQNSNEKAEQQFQSP